MPAVGLLVSPSSPHSSTTQTGKFFPKITKDHVAWNFQSDRSREFSNTFEEVRSGLRGTGWIHASIEESLINSFSPSLPPLSPVSWTVSMKREREREKEKDPRVIFFLLEEEEVSKASLKTVRTCIRI